VTWNLRRTNARETGSSRKQPKRLNEIECQKIAKSGHRVRIAEWPTWGEFKPLSSGLFSASAQRSILAFENPSTQFVSALHAKHTCHFSLGMPSKLCISQSLQSLCRRRNKGTHNVLAQ